MQQIPTDESVKRAKKFSFNGDNLHKDGSRNKGFSYSYKKCRCKVLKPEHTNSPEIRERMRLQSLEGARKQRYDALNYYCGGEPYCQCCGEKLLVFLVFGHINDDKIHIARKLEAVAALSTSGLKRTTAPTLCKFFVITTTGLNTF